MSSIVINSQQTILLPVNTFFIHKLLQKLYAIKDTEASISNIPFCVVELWLQSCSSVPQLEQFFPVIMESESSQENQDPDQVDLGQLQPLNLG